MHRTPTAAAIAALLSLSACGSPEPEVVTSRYEDPNAAALNKAAPIALPPSIEATVTFRCKDNSLIYVDFFEGKTQANLRLKKGGDPVALKADAAGNPYTGGGYTLTGNAQAIDLAGPSGAKACKA